MGFTAKNLHSGVLSLKKHLSCAMFWHFLKCYDNLEHFSAYLYWSYFFLLGVRKVLYFYRGLTDVAYVSYNNGNVWFTRTNCSAVTFCVSQWHMSYSLNQGFFVIFTEWFSQYYINSNFGVKLKVPTFSCSLIAEVQNVFWVNECRYIKVLCIK